MAFVLDDIGAAAMEGMKQAFAESVKELAEVASEIGDFAKDGEVFDGWDNLPVDFSPEDLGEGNDDMADLDKKDISDVKGDFIYDPQEESSFEVDFNPDVFGDMEIYDFPGPGEMEETQGKLDILKDLKNMGDFVNFASGSSDFSNNGEEVMEGEA